MLRRSASRRADQRFRRLERRVEDAEDALATSMSPDRLDDLVSEVDHLAATAVSHDDLLQLRLEVARLAMELTRVRAELQAELDEVHAALLDVADPRYRRRAAG